MWWILKKPVIKINKDIDPNMELKDVRKLKVDSYYSVSDNQTPDSKIKIKKYIKEEKYSYGDTVHLIIEAKDKSGNISKKSVPICINAKKEKKEIHEEKKDESEVSKNVEYFIKMKASQRRILKRRSHLHKTVRVIKYHSNLFNRFHSKLRLFQFSLHVLSLQINSICFLKAMICQVLQVLVRVIYCLLDILVHVRQFRIVMAFI